MSPTKSRLSHEIADLDARAGTIAGKEGELDKLDAELHEQKAEADKRDAELAALELALAAREEGAKAKAAADIRAALAEARKGLDAEWKEFAAERDDIRERDIQLARLREDVEDTRVLYERRIEEKVSQEVALERQRMAALQRQLTGLVEDNDSLRQQLEEYDKVRRARPGAEYDPGTLIDDIRRLKEENRELHLRQAPAELTSDLARLREAEQCWQEDRAFLIAETERLQRQLAAFQVSAFERERLEHVKDALESTVGAYKDEVTRLREQADGLRQRAEGRSPFPQCSKMDDDFSGPRDDLQTNPVPLDTAIPQVRNYLARQFGLYYSEADLRIFLAGLAATKLHLLQGVSGIGKTQLPLRFAEAIGATAVTVAVGADWRTPQELTGYYNAFERRFYESDFTQALYQANCPQFWHQPFFIVLDEMNLSHPEQYFSDVLSVLERKSDRYPGLNLMTAEVTPAPRWLRNGRRLPLPRNVWFIGTANQDETTVGFAEKTLDRSNVLELPPRPDQFDPAAAEALPPYSLAAWDAAFKAAVRSHAAAADQVSRFLQGKLANRLYADFRIAAGPRTVNQLDRFVPMMVAAGGTIGEAADHILAMKVLRKIRGRYEFRRDKIVAFHDELPELWRTLGDCGLDLPIRSLQLLEDELHERGAD
jgi:hypothetical protein